MPNVKTRYGALSMAAFSDVPVKQRDLPRPVPWNSWRKHAACQGIPVEIFFRHAKSPGVERGSDFNADAKAVCRHCPVKTACLEDAITEERSEPSGYRGDRSAVERRQMYRDRQRKRSCKPQECEEQNQ